MAVFFLYESIHTEHLVQTLEIFSDVSSKQTYIIYRSRPWYTERNLNTKKIQPSCRYYVISAPYHLKQYGKSESLISLNTAQPLKVN